MNKKYCYTLTIIVFILFLNGCTEYYYQESNNNIWIPEYGVKYLVKVEDVLDGDTFDCILPNGTIGRIRILGIDTPETSASGNKEFEYGNITDLNCLQTWGLIVKTFAQKLLENNEVYIEFDPISDFKGYYGRWLTYAFLKNGTDYNEILLNLGYARVYKEGKCSKESFYLNLQNQAETNKVGLWSCYSEKQGLMILTVNYDAEGDDRYNLNDEYVTIKNNEINNNSTNSNEINLTGYSIKDETGNTYQFPYGFNLKSKEIVTIYTGTGADNNTALYWGKTISIWNNDHDTAFLINASGVLVDSYSW